MKKNFNNLPWHDAVLLNVSIDRRDAGHGDDVCLRIQWPEGQQVNVVFRECYAALLKMNFGIICEEQILDACLDDKDHELHMLKEKWAALKVNLDSLHCFRIETSSTGSVIKIYAKYYEIEIDAP